MCCEHTRSAKRGDEQLLEAELLRHTPAKMPQCRGLRWGPNPKAYPNTKGWMVVEAAAGAQVGVTSPGFAHLTCCAASAGGMKRQRQRRQQQDRRVRQYAHSRPHAS